MNMPDRRRPRAHSHDPETIVPDSPEVLARAAWARRVKWTLLFILLVVSGLWVATVYFCYAWLVDEASGMPVLFAGVALVVVGAIGARIMKRLEDRSPGGIT